MKSDPISRQDAIDVLEERLRASGYSNVALVSELNRSIGYLMRLPSAEPKTGGWIPCSERLPDDMTYVLTTIHIPGREPVVRSGVYDNGLFHNDNGDVWKATDREVLAWLPLPEPYEAS